MSESEGLIFDIKKFAIHDGPGIRTTVFLKGCPMDCVWCHNPESKKKSREIKCIETKCRLCGNCVATCPEGCFSITEAGHLYDRKRCVKCGRCTTTCISKALESIGRKASAAEIIQDVVKDKKYFTNSGGGLTLSGGEPLMQAAFACEILALAKEQALHTCVETAGLATFDRFEQIRPYTDLFLYDLKGTDPILHKETTGVDNRLILENLKRLDRSGAETILRCPIIPGVNDNEKHFDEIARMANDLRNVVEINLLPFHPYGASKSDHINEKYKMKDIPATSESDLDAYLTAVRRNTDVPVRKG